MTIKLSEKLSIENLGSIIFCFQDAMIRILKKKRSNNQIIKESQNEQKKEERK
jgi:hypothetical protein